MLHFIKSFNTDQWKILMFIHVHHWYVRGNCVYKLKWHMFLLLGFSSVCDKKGWNLEQVRSSYRLILTHTKHGTELLNVLHAPGCGIVWWIIHTYSASISQLCGNNWRDIYSGFVIGEVSWPLPLMKLSLNLFRCGLIRYLGTDSVAWGQSSQVCVRQYVCALNKTDIFSPYLEPGC